MAQVAYGLWGHVQVCRVRCILENTKKCVLKTAVKAVYHAPAELFSA